MTTVVTTSYGPTNANGPTLQQYINDVRRLLHDSTGKYWTDADLTANINKARLRTIADTSCNRQLQVLALSSGVEAYSLGGVTGAIISSGGSGYSPATAITFDSTFGSGATATPVIADGVIADIRVLTPGHYSSTPAMTITDSGGGSGAVAQPTWLDINSMDVVNITVLWGNWRVVLDRWAFTKFQAYARAWTSFTYYPTVWSNYGQSTWYIGPIPAQSYLSEWDTVVKPTDLVLLTDIDQQIADAYASPVPYYAARWAKFQEQGFQEAEMFDRMYQQQVQRTLRAVMLRKLPSAYNAGP